MDIKLVIKKAQFHMKKLTFSRIIDDIKERYESTQMTLVLSHRSNLEHTFFTLRMKASAVASNLQRHSYFRVVGGKVGTVCVEQKQKKIRFRKPRLCTCN